MLWRWVILTHRYIGIGIGLIVLLWCVSGIVMMYVQYPSLTANEQLRGLDTIRAEDCCSGIIPTDLSPLVIRRLTVESLAGRAVARVELPNRQRVTVDLGAGTVLREFDPVELRAIGNQFAATQGWLTSSEQDWVERDQWTVHSRFTAHRPLLKLTNEAGQDWYVSSTSAEVVQATERGERFWNWLGSVIHWLYPTILRQNTAVWAQVVIWLTIIGLFLTTTGVAIGIKHFRLRGRYRRSPYTGWMIWHHYAGLIFGVLTLTWLFSGLLSMNPWGVLEGESFAEERGRLNGSDMTLSEAVRELRNLGGKLPAETVRVSSAFWLGELAFVAFDRQGNATRISGGRIAGELSLAQAEQAAVQMRGEPAAVTLLTGPDSYYYGLHSRPEFPVFRLIYPDETRFYISPVSGQMLRSVGENARLYRWWFEALHRGDFHQLVRTRPVWDVLMVLLLLGVTVGALTGVVLGYRRVSR